MDGRRARSLQDLIRQRQRDVFIGRQRQCDGFRAHLNSDPLDPGRRFVFSVSGQAGIGKTSLLRQLRAIALDRGALTSVIDDVDPDVVSALAAISRQWAGQGGQARAFELRLAEYVRSRDEVLADPQAPRAARELFLTHVVRVGRGIAKTAAPGLTALTDDCTAEEIAARLEQARAFLAGKFRAHDQARLLLAPLDELSPLLVEDMRKLAEHRPLALFVDNYERAAPRLEPWLLRLLEGRFGELPADLAVVLAGQHPLDVNRWGEYATITEHWHLDPFTEEEIAALLARRGIEDRTSREVVLRLSGGLPMLVAMLADDDPRDPERLADPSGAAVDRFFRWVEDESGREDALRAATPRELDEDLLGVLVGPDRAGDVFRRLRQHAFVRESRGRLRYDDVVRRAVLRYERGRSPERFATRNRAIAEHYLARRAALGPDVAPASADAEWWSLLVEECYHRLCGGPRAALPGVLARGLELCEAGDAGARAWLRMLADAERDTGSGLLGEWCHRLSPFEAGPDLAGLRRALGQFEAPPERAGRGAPVADPEAEEDSGRSLLLQQDDDRWSGTMPRFAPPVIE
ncbi:ATP-binding protein [Saccharopolyspora sp. MS10]|uniref:ATP-binding protein n=1 Tax=Saccharopolyspora sp. MS10 TaxID=3385973 RepID=UPI0039A39506